ncbi:MAG: zf-HC2 domain-containing protein [Candidatus Rokubacteria bacterium]|nr:zf-HC2 domain-containing protein [Candidatus Rokubacteria bacterium]MBI3825205.1 zf-HC2 domain-containing protein [Candidatus Rokubacteria bacterium]
MALTHPETELIPYAKGELAAAEHERVAGHLATCAACRESLAAFGGILESLARTAPEPPAVPWGRYRTELREKLEARRHRAWTAWWRRPVPLALSASLAAALVFIAVRGGQQPATVDVASVEQAVLGARLDLLRQYGIVENLDLLENLDVIHNLDGLETSRKG